VTRGAGFCLLPLRWLKKQKAKPGTLLILLAACSGGGPVPVLPQLELANLAPEVHAQIGGARARAVEHPEDGDPSGELGMILHAYGMFEAAAACYERARYYAPTDFRWAYYDGLVLAQTGRADDAIAAFERAAAMKPHERDLELALARELGSAGRMGESREHLEALARTLPDDPEVQLELGRTLLESDEAQAALVPLQHALTLAGDRGDVHYALARAYQRLGDDAQAAAHFAAHAQYRDRPLVGVTTLPREVARFDLGLQAAIRQERGRRLALAGDFAGALAQVDERTRTAPWVDYAIAMRNAHLGQPGAALPLLERARDHAVQAGDSALVAAIDAELQRAHAAAPAP
jgi:Flp pilus assembly protein TadD